MSWTSLCNLSDLTEGHGQYVEIDGFKLAVFLDRGQVHVIDDRCPHAGGSLSAGHVADGCVVCPRHAWTFHLHNGRLKGADLIAVDAYATRLLPRADGVMLVQADLPIY